MPGSTTSHNSFRNKILEYRGNGYTTHDSVRDPSPNSRIYRIDPFLYNIVHIVEVNIT